MSFQSTIPTRLASGVVGTLAFEGPLRAVPGTIKVGAATAADLVMGRAFTIDAADEKFQPGGTGAFGGILANPHARVSIGTTAGGPLAPTMVVQAESQQEWVTMGEIWVNYPAAFKPGDKVYFVNATGALGIGTAGAGQTQIVGAVVSRFANPGAGIGVLSLTGPQ